jgi:hypothetical protein
MQYPTDPGRRRWLRQWALPAGLALGHPAFAQRAADTGLRAGARMVQLLDMSVAQQELSRDYSTGVRLAWAVEGQKGRPLSRISLETVNTDGSAAAVNAALDRIAQDAGILALVGTVGDALAVRVQDGLNQRGLKLPHLGPGWPMAATTATRRWPCCSPRAACSCARPWAAPMAWGSTI